MDGEDYDNLDAFAANLKVENLMDDSMESQNDMENSNSGHLQYEILNNLDILKQQTKRIFEQSRDFRRILKEKDEKIKVLMDLNFTLQLENRELKQQLEGNTSTVSSDTSNVLNLQDQDEYVPQYKPRPAIEQPKVDLLTKKQLINLDLIDVSEDHDSKFIQKMLFSLYTHDEINGISVSGKPSKNPKYLTANATACKPISPIKLQYIYYLVDERVDKSGATGKDELRRKSRQLINKYINRAIQFVKRKERKDKREIN